MNPLTNVKNLQKLNERELKLGFAGKDSKSWHQKFKDSAWIFVGGLPYDLSEGDVIAVFSQYGEIVNINLIRDHKTGKPKGYCFICYEDQRSTNLAVDNLNSIKILNRTIRVDHVEQYKVPKERGTEDDVIKRLHLEGCAPSEEQRLKNRPLDAEIAGTSQTSLRQVKSEPESERSGKYAESRSNVKIDFKREPIDDKSRIEHFESKSKKSETRTSNPKDDVHGGEKHAERYDKKFERKSDEKKRNESKQFQDGFSEKRQSSSRYNDDAYVPKRHCK